MASCLRISILVAILLQLFAFEASAQIQASTGFSFHRENDSVVYASYWGGTGLRVTKLHELPHLTCLRIGYGTELTNDDITYLSTLTNLTELVIGQETIDSLVTINGGLSKLAELASLESLHICKAGLKDTDLEFIALLPKLTHLEFNADEGHYGDSTLSDRCADFLIRAKSLESICVQGHGRLTDAFVSTLTKGLPDLQHLRFYNNNLTDKSLRLLATRSKKLRWLDLASDKFTDKGVEHLSHAKSMSELWLRSRSLTQECVKHVAGLQKLKRLELTIPTIDDSGIMVLVGLQRLELLALRQTQLTDSQFLMFRNHPTLESAFINGEKLSEDLVYRLKDEIPHLRHLSVGSKNPDLQAAVNRTLQPNLNDRD